MTMRKETDRFSNFFSFALILDFISFDKIFFSKKKKEQKRCHKQTKYQNN